jgi:nitrate/TMAO reductase-like tetraheme cytochrome c subunit
MQPVQLTLAAADRARVAWALILLTLLVPQTVSGQPEFTKGGAETCLECHNEAEVMGILQTPHAVTSDPRSPAAQRECESCHGASSAHAHAPTRSTPMRYGSDSNAPEERRNAACLHCHDDDTTEWTAAPHASLSENRDPLSCARCHSLHRPDDPALSAWGRVGQCLECHPGVLGRSLDDSVHRTDPSGRGELSCTSCHDPHAREINARCLVCHPQDAEGLAAQTKRARTFHRSALRRDRSCTKCHEQVGHQQPS